LNLYQKLKITLATKKISQMTTKQFIYCEVWRKNNQNTNKETINQLSKSKSVDEKLIAAHLIGKNYDNKYTLT
jgi:hypothetical protein